LVIPPGYFISELIRDKWPSEHSAIGVGISGGLWADSQVEFRDGRFEEVLRALHGAEKHARIQQAAPLAFKLSR
jgi:hypothetical protein